MSEPESEDLELSAVEAAAIDVALSGPLPGEASSGASDESPDSSGDLVDAYRGLLALDRVSFPAQQPSEGALDGVLAEARQSAEEKAGPSPAVRVGTADHSRSP